MSLFLDRFAMAVNAPPHGGGLAVAASRASACVTVATELYPSEAIAGLAVELAEFSQALGEAAASRPMLAIAPAAERRRPIYEAFLSDAAGIRVTRREQELTLKAYLGLAVAVALLNEESVSRTIVEGVGTLGRAETGRINVGWRNLIRELPREIGEVDALCKRTIHRPVLDFLHELKRLMASHARGAKPPGTRSPEETPEAADESQRSQTGPRQDAKPDQDQQATKRQPPEAETLLEWQINRAEFAPWHDKVGLPISYARLPPAALRRVTLGVLAALKGDARTQAFGLLAACSLLAALPPQFAVVMTIARSPDDLQPGPGLAYDVRGYISWSLSSYQNSGKKDRRFLVPVPNEVDGVASQFAKLRPLARNLGELLGIPTNEKEREVWLEDYRSLLRSQGGQVHAAFPSRFAYSLPAVYMETGASDVEAAAMTLNFAWAPAAVLHYVNLPGERIASTAAAVYRYLGFGLPVMLPPDYQEGGTHLGLTRDEFRAGWERLVKAARAARESLSAADSLQDVQRYWNELVVLNLQMFCILTGHRTTRLERICWGSVYGHDDLVWLNDKKVPNDEAARLMPVTRLLRSVLNWHGGCIRQLATTAERFRAAAESLLQLASGRCTYLRAAFFFVVIQGSDDGPRLARAPVRHRDLGAVAQSFFNRPANVGRRFFASELAAAGADRWLLRYFTHHSRQGAEVEHETQIMSVRTMVSALRARLDAFHEELSLIHPAESSGARSLSPGAYPTPRAPLIVQVRFGQEDEFTHRDRTFQAFSLAGCLLIEKVREALLASPPPSPWASLALHLIAFEAVMDLDSLESVLGEPSASFVRIGDVLALRLRGTVIQPVQPPTQAVLARGEEFSVVPVAAEIHEEVKTWLVESLPEFRWRELKKDDAASAKVPAPVQQLLTCATHWAALHVPPALNTCWQIHANTLNLDSYLRLAEEREPDGAVTLDLDPGVFGSKVAAPAKQLLNECATLVHKWGDTKRAVGGEKSRARGLAQELCELQVPPPGTAAAILRAWVDQECDLMLSGARKAVEVSTLSTYLSHLKSSLEQISPLDDPRAWGDEEWGRFLDDVEGSVQSQGSSPDARARRKEAVAQRLVSARRLLRALSQQGYPIPRERLLPAGTRAFAPVEHASAGVWVNERDLEAVSDLVQSALQDFPVRQASAKTLLTTLGQSPLRAAEACLLERQCLTDDSHCIVVRNSAFSHIKRDASIRLIPATPEQVAAIQKQSAFVARLGEDAEHLFLFPSSTDTREADGLLSLITEALQRVTGDAHARVHSLRANVLARMIAPGWEVIGKGLLQGTAGPMECAEFFSYQRDKWLVPATASALAGHSSRLTAFASYLGPWPLLRSAALRSTLVELACPAPYIQRQGLSDGARRQAKSRAGVAFDSWSWFHKKLDLPSLQWPRLQEVRSVDSTKVELPEVQQLPARTLDTSTVGDDVRYLSLRSLGVEADVATARLRMGHQRSLHLEDCLRRMPHAHVLRQRVKSDPVGRGARADLRWLDGSIATAWLAGCPQIGSEAGLTLDALLRRQTLSGVEWKDEASATKCARHALAALPQELALEFTFGSRHEQMDVRAALLTLGRVHVAAPHRDLGALPKVQVIWREERERTDVDKARLTVLFRVLVSALVTLRSEM